MADHFKKKDQLFKALANFEELTDKDKDAIWQLALQTGMPIHDDYLAILCFAAVKTREVRNLDERVGTMLSLFEGRMDTKVEDIQNILDQIMASTEAHIAAATESKVNEIVGTQITSISEKASSEFARAVSDMSKAEETAILSKARSFLIGGMFASIGFVALACLAFGLIGYGLAYNTIRSDEGKFAALAKSENADLILGVAAFSGNAKSLLQECARGSSTHRIVNGAAKCRPELTYYVDGRYAAPAVSNRFSIISRIVAWSENASVWLLLSMGTVFGLVIRRLGSDLVYRFQALGRIWPLSWLFGDKQPKWR